MFEDDEDDEDDDDKYTFMKNLTKYVLKILILDKQKLTRYD